MASYSLDSHFVISKDFCQGFCVFSSHIQKEIVLYVLILNKPKTPRQTQNDVTINALFHEFDNL